MANSPCGGCPPCCPKCVFDPKAAGPVAASAREIVSKTDYACIREDAGPVVVQEGTLGMVRGENFHPLTAGGAEHLHNTNNALRAYA